MAALMASLGCPLAVFDSPPISVLALVSSLVTPTFNGFSWIPAAVGEITDVPASGNPPRRFDGAVVSIFGTKLEPRVRDKSDAGTSTLGTSETSEELFGKVDDTTTFVKALAMIGELRYPATKT